MAPPPSITRDIKSPVIAKVKDKFIKEGFPMEQQKMMHGKEEKAWLPIEVLVEEGP
jgi:hypothetical protein